jgi:hypothetical protein
VHATANLFDDFILIDRFAAGVDVGVDESFMGPIGEKKKNQSIGLEEPCEAVEV